MEQYINNNVKNIEISGIRKFFNLVSGKEDVVSLTIGQPDFNTPEHIKEATKQAIDDNQTTYTPNAGILPLRQAIHDVTNEKYGLNYDSEDEIIVTVGASQAIDVTLRTIIKPGEEVLLPGPVYPGYEPLIKLAGGVPVHIDTRDNDFKMTAQLIKEHITDKTKCVILPYPSNPTGVTLTEDELEEIAQLLKDQPIFILADEIYSELTYNEPHVSIASFEEVREQTIVIQGVSKSHSMTGFRIGYLLADRSIRKHILKVHQYNVSCPTSISQYAALQALTVGKNDSEIMCQSYAERRAYVLKRLKQMGLDVVEPDGAFYVFPKLKVSDHTSFDLGLRLVDEAGLALVPGDAFSEYGQGYMRLSYAYNMEVLEEGLNRLEDFLSKQ
ncbi:aminotransferase A [Alkalibacillus haloalkaliphilus]|uniref:Aminotransferase n=1 Tax=Alkalibacillus haloalkaliphilus TaxID=94136 RepID=A0A511W2L5_9BACI|nr:aminotransferase A [Alkalibacillus haloalkaliphilus]GEN45329.1 putative N-acetyl-LL-diaminopimelate aminotransferase [Alkalibacillus haloalkaliphilus]